MIAVADLWTQREDTRLRVEAQIRRDIEREPLPLQSDDEDLPTLESDLDRLNKVVGVRDCLNCGGDFCYSLAACPSCGYEVYDDVD